MNRRDMLKLSSYVVAAASAPAVVASAEAPGAAGGSIARWDFVEIDLPGPSSGNPYIDIEVSATFRYQHRAIHVNGFYDGEGSYKIRFMPDEVGAWNWTTASNAQALDGKTGTFECVAQAAGNRGPVEVRDSFHFGYADGTPFVECGTTCYAWAFQAEQTQRETIQTLTTSPFNKLRMCLFPKWYQYNRSEPPMYPFPRSGDVNDYSRFTPAYFQHLDHLILELRGIGVQADLILFHPYDKWGYQSMPPEVDDRYLRYVIARFSAFRNVWWSLANEFDLLKSKTNADWDRYARIVEEFDPSSHLRSIHYSRSPYDYSRGWCTHAGIQDSHMDRAAGWRIDWRKPVVFDECRYEGDIASRWGSLSGDGMTRRFWLTAAQGTYCGHGETYIWPDNILWWSHGGVLHGTSPKKIAFLRKLLEVTIAVGPGPIGFTSIGEDPYGARRSNNSVLFYYFDDQQPAVQNYNLPEGKTYTAEYVDTIALTRTPLPGEYTGKVEVKLPGTPWGSLCFREKGVA
ncbi:MAG TPA: DUF5060 domain-containing protein [Terracidiphilus sp.]|nr:DUF5060 domain-containing protein [Terracidiphilus sp.]